MITDEMNEEIKKVDVSHIPVYNGLMEENAISERKADGHARIWNVLQFEKGKLKAILTYPTLTMAQKSIKNIIYRQREVWKFSEKNMTDFTIVEGSVYYAGETEWNRLEKY